MSHWLDNTLQHLHVGEALIAGGVEGLIHGWQAPAADVIGKLHAGAERWQAAIRQMQLTVNATVNLVDILRARTFL
jgi:hypothetical protein